MKNESFGPFVQHVENMPAIIIFQNHFMAWKQPFQRQTNVLKHESICCIFTLYFGAQTTSDNLRLQTIRHYHLGKMVIKS